MKKISFPEPACRFNCPHFKIVGAMLNETCYCMKKGRKGKQFQKRISSADPRTGVRSG